MMRAPATALILVLAACAEEDSPPGEGGPDAAGLTDAAVPSPDAAPSQLASLTGVVTRSAAPMGDARGHIYVALFDRDPVVDMATAQLVGRALLENADLAAAGASVAYTLSDLTPRAGEYFLVAFLDDNGNVDTANPDDAGPDRGDLVSLDGLAAPRVAVPTAGAHAHDVVLNSVLPF